MCWTDPNGPCPSMWRCPHYRQGRPAKKRGSGENAATTLEPRMSLNSASPEAPSPPGSFRGHEGEDFPGADLFRLGASCGLLCRYRRVRRAFRFRNGAVRHPGMARRLHRGASRTRRVAGEEPAGCHLRAWRCCGRSNGADGNRPCRPAGAGDRGARAFRGQACSALWPIRADARSDAEGSSSRVHPLPG